MEEWAEKVLGGYKMKLTQEECVKLLNKWPIDYTSQYRRFTCANCGRDIAKAWHIHCLDGGYKREFHLCRKCGLKYELKYEGSSNNSNI